jgi:transcription elongation factor Elf1
MSSEKQTTRQKERNSNGRYKEMAHCEVCNKALGNDYYSDNRCNDELHGLGLVLCAKCGVKIEQMETKEAYEFLKSR